MSLKARFFTAFSILGFSTLLIASLGFYYFEYEQILSQQEGIRLGSFEKLLSVCGESALEKNFIPVINFVGTFSGERYILSATCADNKGRIRADTVPARIGTFLTHEPSQSLLAGELSRRPYALDGRAALEFIRTKGAGESSATAAINFNEDYFRRETKAHLLDVIKRLLSISILLIAPIISLAAFILATALSKPIYSMERASREYGSGNFDYPLEIPDTGDEIGSLTRSLSDMARKLSELDSLKQRFFACITHDLRSPLTAVQGYADLIATGMMGQVTEKQSAGLRIILDSADRLNNYIDDILDLAKLQSGSFELNLTETDIERILRSVADMYRANLEQQGIFLLLDIQSGLPSVRVDAKLIHRCVANYVSNAFKFTPKGGAITIRAGREGGLLKIEVKDTGPGIPPDKLEFVFDKFYQVTETKDYARKSGTGLGLTITKEIIQLHGGQVWVESGPGKGSTFVLTLPVCHVPANVVRLNTT